MRPRDAGAQARYGAVVRWGFRTKLLLATVGLMAASLLVADLYLSRALERDLKTRLQTDLRARLSLIEQRAAEARAPQEDLAAWDRLADDLGRRADARVTLLDMNGRVVGDSDVPLADLPKVENHRGRPEIEEAIAGRLGVSERWSETVSWRSLYVARRFSRDGRPSGLVRLAVPLTDVEQAIVGLHRMIGIGSVVALAVSVLLATVAAQIFGRSLREVREAARQIAQGNLDVRVHASTNDEIAELGRTLDQLAASLSSTLRELREERDRLGGILEAMEEGVLVVDPARTIRMANPAARVLLLTGAESPTDVQARRVHADDDLAGRSLLQAVRNAELDAILDQTLTHHAISSGEIAVDRPRPRRLLVHAAPLGGDPHGAVVVLVDVTEIRRLESIRKDFVANVSHELRTPLTAVRTALETARSALAQDPQEASRFLDIADRHTERLTALVRDLLDLSRIESGRLALRPETVDQAEVAAAAAELFRETAMRKRVRLTLAIPPELPPVTADRGALTQVVTNLVENAVKYCDEGGAVTLRAQATDTAVQLSVVDTGPGIAPKHLPRLFERFYRVDAGRSRDRGGTGLGLSIVKHLVEAMGGTVAVESQLGRGSTFSVTLPRALALPAEAERPRGAAQPNG